MEWEPHVFDHILSEKLAREPLEKIVLMKLNSSSGVTMEALDMIFDL